MYVRAGQLVRVAVRKYEAVQYSALVIISVNTSASRAPQASP